MKITVDSTGTGKTISWSTDIGVCIATASHGRVEIAECAPARICDAANAAHRELASNPHADLRHYEGLTLPADDELDTP